MIEIYSVTESKMFKRKSEEIDFNIFWLYIVYLLKSLNHTLTGAADMSRAQDHILADYTGFFPTVKDVAKWMLKLMEHAIDESTANRVHSHVEIFDGTTSPPGFAAVVST